MNKKFVLMESPFRGNNYSSVELNVDYGRLCLHDCLIKGEAPFASHLLYTLPKVLNDKIPQERKMGMEAGWEIGKRADLSAVYVDLIGDWSHFEGIAKGVVRAIQERRPVEFRNLPDDVLNSLDSRIIVDRTPKEILTKELDYFLASHPEYWEPLIS
jgi:hypothetical protein